MEQQGTSQNHEQNGREPLDPALGLGEFANQMILLADIGQSDLADILDVHATEVSYLMTGRGRLSGKLVHRLQNAFSLTDEELKRLIENDVPRQYVRPASMPNPVLGGRTKGVRAQRVAVIKASLPPLDDPRKTYDVTVRTRSAAKEKQNVRDLSSAHAMLGAFAVRAEQGPPLNEAEVDLVKFLIEHS